MADAKPLPSEVTYRYSRSPAFRAVYATGVFGGIMPSGDIAINFAVDRSPVPLTVTHALKDGRRLGKELNRESSGSYIDREIQVEVWVNISLARALRGWLDEYIAKYDERLETMADLPTELEEPS